jgi:hypothetical protein
VTDGEASGRDSEGADDEERAATDDEKRETTDDEEHEATDGGEDAEEKFPEPREYDPRDQFGDPERDLAPSVDIPEVENPADRLPDYDEVDREIKSAFWTAVLWMNLAIGCLVLGPLYVLIQGGTRLGGIVTLVGVLSAFRLYQTIRAFKQRNDDDGDG